MCWFLGILRHSADGQQNSTTHPVPPAVPMMPMMCRMTSYKSTVEWLGEKSGEKMGKTARNLGKAWESQNSPATWGNGNVIRKASIEQPKMAVCQNLVPLLNIKIAGKWMFIPLKWY